MMPWYGRIVPHIYQIEPVAAIQMRVYLGEAYQSPWRAVAWSRETAFRSTMCQGDERKGVSAAGKWTVGLHKG